MSNTRTGSELIPRLSLRALVRAQRRPLRNGLRSDVISWHHVDNNIYGCSPCPWCGSVFRASYYYGPVTWIDCDDCGYCEQAHVVAVHGVGYGTRVLTALAVTVLAAAFSEAWL
mgnify:CR=1 FL=1